MSRNMNLLDWILLLFLSIVWGGSFFFVEVALSALPIFTIVFLRVSLGALLLSIYLIITGKKFPKEKRIWKRLIVMGVLNNVIPFCLIVTGQQYISGGFASILNATTPFFTVIFAHVFTEDEKINTRKIIGITFGIVGVILLIGFEKVSSGSSNLIGALTIIMAAVSYSLAGIWGKGFKSIKIEPVVTATGQLICSSIILFPIMLITNKPWTLSLPGFRVWASLLGIAFFSTALAYFIYFKILSSAGATNVLLVTFLVPVSAILLGVFVLSEDFKAQYIYGIISIGIGLIFIDGRLVDKVMRRK